MSDTGCGNYDDRPSACRDWYCMWLRDRHQIFNEDERPDRVGLFLTASTPDADGKQTIYAHPIRPDVMANAKARALVSRLRQYVQVQVLAYRGAAAQLTVEQSTQQMVA